MPVRLRITLWFSLIFMLILSLVCGGIYYFSYQSRLHNLKLRLTNRAISTARLLSQREVFDPALVQRIDSSTTISLKDKVVQAYDYQNQIFYTFSDHPGSLIRVPPSLLDDARVTGRKYFTSAGREVIAYHYATSNARMVMVVGARDEEGFAALTTLAKILILSWFLGTLIVLVSGYFFSRRLLRPVAQITEDVRDISAHNLTRRIATGSSRDEWHELAATLNDLLNRLQESFDVQRRFISNASHELSTPLTSISSQLEVTLQRDRDASEYRKVMESVYQDVHHMSKLTQTLLQVAKTAGNAGGLEIKPVRIDEVLMNMPLDIARTDPRYALHLSFGELPEEPARLEVQGNETLMGTAIRNIVVNACKYSPDHQAFVALDVDESLIRIRVRDNGPGIPPEEMERIFQPFYRVRENISEGGFGLGLSLAERIIKMHKGWIEIRNREEGGTEFVIGFPHPERDI